MRVKSSGLPSRFQIGDSVIAGLLNGGNPGVVTAVHFTIAKVGYDIEFENGSRRKFNSERVHPAPDAKRPVETGFDIYM